MKKFRAWHWLVTGIATLGMAFSLAIAPQLARAQGAHPLLGGPTGLVRFANGAPLEGIGVRLIAPQTGIRTTVYTNEEGRYEFPKLEPGTYALHIARPREFKPYQRDSVQITGADRFEDIVLERVVDSEYLPPTPEILAQLSGVEWMSNLPGTGKCQRKVEMSSFLPSRSVLFQG